MFILIKLLKLFLIFFIKKIIKKKKKKKKKLKNDFKMIMKYHLTKLNKIKNK